MVELVYGDYSIIELLDSELIYGQTESRMSADRHVVILQKCPKLVDFATVVPARAFQRFHFGATDQSAQKPNSSGLVVEAGANGLFRYDDDRLTQSLINQLVESDEHQRSTLA